MLLSSVSPVKYVRTVRFCARTATKFAIAKQQKSGYAWLRDDLVKMGPVYVKLGQIVSTRTDLVPEAIVHALAGLQTDVTPIAFEDVRDVFREDFEKDIQDVFSSFEKTPIASASIGQVHRAVLKDTSRPVAVKIQRPFVRDSMMEELEILKHILNMFIHFGRREVDEAMSMLLDMERTALDETDYRCEMKNMRTFRQAFREESVIVVPRVSKQWTSTRVLTMEYIPSKKVTSMEANNNMSSTLMRTFMKTVINHGYLHCDPHPGNIGVMSDGKLVLYDYGMVARLQTNIRATMRRLSIALISRDTETLGNLLFGEDIIRGALSGATNINELHPHEYTTFYRLCRHVYAYMDNLDAHEFVRKISNDRLIDSANLPIKLNPNVFFLFRSFAVLEGVCKTIDPNFSYHTIIMEMTVEMMDLEIFMEKARVDMRSSVRGDDSSAYIARLESVAENMATETAVNRAMFGTMFFGMLLQMVLF